MAATIVGLLITAQPRAHADGNDPSTIYLGLTIFGITDVTFTAIDVVQAVRREPLSRTYGVVEIALGLSQVALVAVLEQQNPPHTSGYRMEFDGAFLWTIALAAHGVFAVARAPSDSARVSASLSRGWALAPAVLEAESRSSLPGVALAGVF
jgi:hypothetical protein